MSFFKKSLEVIHSNYGFSKIVDLSYEDALVKVTEELQKEGFGVLTEIDVKATLKKKLDVDHNNYKILVDFRGVAMCCNWVGASVDTWQVGDRVDVVVDAHGQTLRRLFKVRCHGQQCPVGELDAFFFPASVKLVAMHE